MLFLLEVSIIIPSALQMRKYVLGELSKWSRLTIQGGRKEKIGKHLKRTMANASSKKGCGPQLIQNSEPGNWRSGNVTENILKL